MSSAEGDHQQTRDEQNDDSHSTRLVRQAIVLHEVCLHEHGSPGLFVEQGERVQYP
jgi:hypothetical protein